ncbi:MAG: hypothetical protein E6G01_12985 [Actinobacteria bacterium]|nr:MAG: hypothetical protein E6G01_12985 [Actinomycetota bacterium]
MTDSTATQPGLSRRLSPNTSAPMMMLAIGSTTVRAGCVAVSGPLWKALVTMKKAASPVTATA